MANDGNSMIDQAKNEDISTTDKGNSHHSAEDISQAVALQLSRSDRLRQPPVWMKDYIGSIVSTGIPFFPTGSCHPPTFPYHISTTLSEDYMHFLFNLTNQILKWIDAMNSEL